MTALQENFLRKWVVIVNKQKGTATLFTSILCFCLIKKNSKIKFCFEFIRYEKETLKVVLLLILDKYNTHQFYTLPKMRNLHV